MPETLPSSNLPPRAEVKTPTQALGAVREILGRGVTSNGTNEMQIRYPNGGLSRQERDQVFKDQVPILRDIVSGALSMGRGVTSPREVLPRAVAAFDIAHMTLGDPDTYEPFRGTPEQVAIRQRDTEELLQYFEVLQDALNVNEEGGINSAPCGNERVSVNGTPETRTGLVQQALQAISKEALAAEGPHADQEDWVEHRINFYQNLINQTGSPPQRRMTLGRPQIESAQRTTGELRTIDSLSPQELLEALDRTPHLKIEQSALVDLRNLLPKMQELRRQLGLANPHINPADIEGMLLITGYRFIQDNQIQTIISHLTIPPVDIDDYNRMTGPEVSLTARGRKKVNDWIESLDEDLTHEIHFHPDWFRDSTSGRAIFSSGDIGTIRNATNPDQIQTMQDLRQVANLGYGVIHPDLRNGRIEILLAQNAQPGTGFWETQIAFDTRTGQIMPGDTWRKHELR